MSSALDWLMLAGALGALHALLLSLVNLHLFRRSDPHAAPRPDLLVSVCIPARDEAEHIAAAVHAALASDHPRIEVLVYDHESRDATGRIVADIASRDPRCRLVTTRALPPGWVGKQHACARLAEAARGEWLLFTDADVRLASDAVRRALDYALRSRAALVSTFPRQRIGSFGELLLVPTMFFLLLSYLPFPLMRSTRLPSAGAGCGQFLLAERGAYRAAGGHASFRDRCHDGVRLPRAFRAAGFMTDLFDGTDVAEVRMYHGLRTAWRGFSKDAWEGIGSVTVLAALAVLHVLAHVLPWVLLPVLLVTNGPPLATLFAAIAVVAAASERAVLARRFGHPLALALLHPLTIVLMIALQFHSALLHARGARSWRGRTVQAHAVPSAEPRADDAARDEHVVLVDAQDRELGTRGKLDAHRAPGALHRAFSVFLFDSRGRTLLQRRAEGKYHFAGLWSNACCGHPRPGERLRDAAVRRLDEELGIVAPLERVASFVYEATDPGSGLVEHELDHVFIGRFDGEPAPDPAEASACRWLTPAQLETELAREPGTFTPWLAPAWATLRAADALASNQRDDKRVQTP